MGAGAEDDASAAAFDDVEVGVVGGGEEFVLFLYKYCVDVPLQQVIDELSGN